LSEQDSYNSRDLEKVSQQLAKPLYDAKIQPSTLLPKLVGNMYTASLYAALASIIHNKHNSLGGQRVLMFSYGSGLASTMFSFRIQEGQFPFTLSNITEVMDIQNKLDSRHEFLPEDFVENLKRMETLYGAKDFISTSEHSLLQPGAFYLTKVDSMYRRFYSRKIRSPSDNFEKQKLANGTAP